MHRNSNLNELQDLYAMHVQKMRIHVTHYQQYLATYHNLVSPILRTKGTLGEYIKDVQTVAAANI